VITKNVPSTVRIAAAAVPIIQPMISLRPTAKAYGGRSHQDNSHSGG
jgi:hypothetical protein